MYLNRSTAKVKEQLLDNFLCMPYAFLCNVCLSYVLYLKCMPLLLLYLQKKTSCQETVNKSTLVNNVGPCIFSEIQCHRIESHKS